MKKNSSKFEMKCWSLIFLFLLDTFESFLYMIITQVMMNNVLHEPEKDKRIRP